MDHEQTLTYRLRHVSPDGRVTWESTDTWTHTPRQVRQAIVAGMGSTDARMAVDAASGHVLVGQWPDGRPVRRLQWGIQPPDGPSVIHRVAWGARAGYQSGRHVDLLWDRQDAVGTEQERRALTAWVDRALPILRDMAAAGELPSPRDRQQVAIRGEGYCLVADPRASYGYLYMGAWPDATAVDPLPRLAAIHQSAAKRRCTVCKALPGYRHETSCRKAYAAPRRAAATGGAL